MSNLKKVVALALALALVLTMFANASIKSDLPYVDTGLFTDAQLSAAAILKPLGILEGTGAGELGAGSLTRAQMVTFIYRLLNGGDGGVQNYYSKTSIFSDVDPDAWYAPYINWAYAAKIVEGYGKTFGPEDKVTGAQAAAMLVRIFGKIVTGDDYAQKAQSYAIAYGLDAGVETKGVYENELGRGDMFLFVANALLVEYEKDHCLAVDIFDLDVIYGAVLMGVNSYGANKYNVFTFRTDSNGPEFRFITDLLCIEQSGPETTADFDSIGCKYTLLVSRDKVSAPTWNEGYRWLYAAYEESQNNYYKVVKGTVDDGVLTLNADGDLVYRANGKKVPLDPFVRFYYNGTETDFKGFTDSFWFSGVYNPAIYKLIDINGDGDYEFVLVQRLTLADLAAQTITAKVTAIAADGQLTLTKEDGTTVKVYPGSYWVFNAGKWTLIDNDNKIKEALGIDQPGHAPYTGVSNVYYDFVVGGDYVYDIKISEKTKFNGDYGIFVTWSTPLTMYKNMPYACFVNEKSEYFWAYVNTVDSAPAAMMTFIPGNSLIYFTDGDASDDVVSFYTAPYWNSNYTYDLLWADCFVSDNAASESLKVVFEDSVISEIHEKETYNYSKVAEFGATYAVFDIDPADPAGDGSVPAIKYWDVKAQAYKDIPAATLIDTSADRTIEGIPMKNYKDIEGKYVVKIESADVFYGVEDVEDCEGFVFVTDAEISVSIGGTGDDIVGSDLQIYRRNGFWHLRVYADIPAIDDETVVVTWKGHVLSQNADDEWIIALGDGTDPEEIYEENPEGYRMAELIKGFDDAYFTTKVNEALDDYFEEYGEATEGALIAYDYHININSGVVFAFGSVTNHDARDWDDLLWRWVAYDVKTFNANYGYGNYQGDIRDAFGNLIPDEMIFTKINGTYYVKALKVTDDRNVTLPDGWIAANGYMLAVYGGKTGDVDLDKGWAATLYTFSKDGIQKTTVWTKLFDSFAQKGDVMLVKVEGDKLVEVYRAGIDVFDYIDTVSGSSKYGKGIGWLTGAKVVEGLDTRVTGDYFKYDMSSKSVIYSWIDGDGNFKYTDDFSKAPKNGNLFAEVQTVSCGGFVFVMYTGTWSNSIYTELDWALV